VTFFIHFASVSRAKLKTSTLGVGCDCVDEFEPDRLDPGNERLARLHILLEERDAIDPFFELVRGDIRAELDEVIEAADAEPLPSLVVLSDERRRESMRGFDKTITSDHRDGSRRVDAERA